MNDNCKSAEGDHNSDGVLRQRQNSFHAHLVGQVAEDLAEDCLHKQDSTRSDKSTFKPSFELKKTTGGGSSLFCRFLLIYTFIIALAAYGIGVTFLLKESNCVAQVYKNQLNLINTVNKAIKNMDVCILVLERYCKLIEKQNSKSTQLNDDEKAAKKRLKDNLDCKDELSADYHLKIKKSFDEHFKNILLFKEAQISLMISGDFDKMKSEQENYRNVPAETCRFICDLEKTDFKSNTDETVYETGWKIILAFFS